jgi:hypothetical protein
MSRARTLSGFEDEVRRLRLDAQTCEASREPKKRCARNKSRCYIPEWLLKRWILSVDPDLSS